MSTYHAAEAPHMPLRPKCLDDRIRYRLAALLALCAVSMRMAVYAPGIAILLHERCRGVERITALRAEEVTSMPFGATSYNDLALDRRLA